MQGIRELISALQSRDVAVYLISGGFRELTLPIARELGVPAENVFANRMNWQVPGGTSCYLCRHVAHPTTPFAAACAPSACCGSLELSAHALVKLRLHISARTPAPVLNKS